MDGWDGAAEPILGEGAVYPPITPPPPSPFINLHSPATSLVTWERDIEKGGYIPSMVLTFCLVYSLPKIAGILLEAG